MNVVSDMAAAKEFVAKLSSLRTMPAVGQKALALARDERTTTQQLAQCIAMDPSLTAHVLRFANSPIFGAREPIRDVVSAIIVLGFRQSCDLAVAASLRCLDSGKDEESEAQWRHALLVSSTASRLAREYLDNRGSDETFVAGLLLDIGKVALREARPELYARAFKRSLSIDAAYAVCFHSLGFHAGDLGAAVVSAWRLAPEIGDCAQHHCVSASFGLRDVWGESATLLWMLQAAKLIVGEYEGVLPADVSEAQLALLCRCATATEAAKKRFSESWWNVRSRMLGQVKAKSA